jgi:hypothetical protein
MSVDAIENASISNGMLDVADDWAVWSPVGGPKVLVDFELSREIVLGDPGQGFASWNLLTDPAFFYFERANREAMNAGARAAGIPDLAQDCDTDTELRIGIVEGSPPTGPPVRVLTDGSGDVITAQCGERRVGMIRLSATPVPSPVLWPAIARRVAIHPGLLKAARKAGRVPVAIESEYLVMGRKKIHMQWTLTSISKVSVSYPLKAAHGNARVRFVHSKLSPSILSLASEAVKGRYGDGPPDLARWTARVKKIAEKDRAAAVIEAMQVTMMFPHHLETCKEARADWLCKFMAASRDLWRTEPALAALHTILEADPKDPRRGDKALKAMINARASPLGKHPALQAAFAIEIARADLATQTEAERAGLPVKQLEVLQQAIEAYPYNPLYWMDLSQVFFFGEWDFVTGMFLTDIAMSLPMPEAMKGTQMKRLRTFLSGLPAKFPYLYP